ncbi:MAG: hypothetical protein GF398_19080 [Chitinivibrionales bacterium]|nr:hypothetical protein [Chitinivibrionales bacterium]
MLIAYAVLICFMFTGAISPIVGTKTLVALERLIGMLLTTVAVEMRIKGVKQLLI